MPENTLTKYQKALETKIIPSLYDFTHDLLIVSASYGANHVDYLMKPSLQSSVYGVITQCLLTFTYRIFFGYEEVIFLKL
ncbi:MAG: hypothetical protein ACQJCO_09590 [cyanobacterium endosymbiont of Rhopalodia sterrenbergii]